LSELSVVSESCLLSSLEVELVAGVDRFDAAASLADATRSWKLVGGRELVLAGGKRAFPASSSSVVDDSVETTAAAAAFDLRPLLPVKPASCVYT